MNGEKFPYRKEIKYKISLQKALLIEKRLADLLVRDAYCGDDCYSVQSFYFDSVNNIDFAEKLAGIHDRKKIRIRTYNRDASLCKLEIKEKHGDWQYKQNFLISPEDVKEISFGNYGVLKKYFDETKTSVKAYSIMELEHYQPAVLIEYDRTAYQFPMYNTRITLDRNIRSSETNLDIFTCNDSYVPVMNKEAVLEIKYSEKLMGFISDVLVQFELTQGTYSKYCAGRRIYYDFNY